MLNGSSPSGMEIFGVSGHFQESFGLLFGFATVENSAPGDQ
jgi:hypothetical protein